MKVRKQKKNKNDEFSDIIPESSSALAEGAVFLLITLVILLFGLSVLYSTASMMTGSDVFQKQLVFAMGGFVIFCGVVLFGYRWPSDWSIPILIGVMALLVIPLILKSEATEIKGAHRWIKLGPISIQPSEFAKIALTLFLAKFISSHTRAVETAQFWKVYVPCGIVSGMVIGLVLAGRDLGTSVLLGMLFLAMMFAGGIKWYWIGGSLFLLGIAGSIFVYNSPFRLGRVLSFLDPEKYAQNEGYQLMQSLMALGSGNWTGIGFTESRLKLKYLPEAHTDFILSIAGEELGFAAIAGLLIAYGMLLITGTLIAVKARTRQGRLVAFGMTFFLTLQAIINTGVICGAFPTKGMPAPFISYGGSNLITAIAAAGFIFSVALDTHYPDYPAAIRARIFGKGRKKSTTAPSKNKKKRA